MKVVKKDGDTSKTMSLWNVIHMVSSTCPLPSDPSNHAKLTTRAFTSWSISLENLSILISVDLLSLGCSIKDENENIPILRVLNRSFHDQFPAVEMTFGVLKFVFEAPVV